MVMGATRRRVTPEYRDQAVQLVLEGGRSIREVASNIGVHEVTLGNWVRKAKNDGKPPEKKNLDSSERDELERLRAENAELRMQVEFAKKVASWFAKDQR